MAENVHFGITKLRWVILWVFLLAGIFGQGCDPVAKHRALTLFFDGVPPLESTEEGQVIEAGGEEGESGQLLKEGGSDDAFLLQADTQTEEAEPAPPTRVQHPPYAMKMCDSCHETRESNTGAPIGFSLLMEKTELCVMCHDGMTKKSLREKYDWVHGPVQYGACVECHHPHESVNPYMLHAAPVRNVCFRCHDEERLSGSEIHSDVIGEIDCTECHHPHGSEERYFLR